MDPRVALIETGRGEPLERSLDELSQRTLDMYRKLLQTFSHESSAEHMADLDKALEEYGRLKIWIEQTGVSLQGRDSLDEALRDKHSLREAIVSTFKQLLRLVWLGGSISPSFNDRVI
jgi:hypothetical protein